SPRRASWSCSGACPACGCARCRATSRWHAWTDEPATRGRDAGGRPAGGGPPCVFVWRVASSRPIRGARPRPSLTESSSRVGVAHSSPPQPLQSAPNDGAARDGAARDDACDLATVLVRGAPGAASRELVAHVEQCGARVVPLDDWGWGEGGASLDRAAAACRTRVALV